MHPGVLLFTDTATEHDVTLFIGGTVVKLDGRLEHVFVVANVIGDEVCKLVSSPLQKRLMAFSTPQVQLLRLWPRPLPTDRSHRPQHAARCEPLSC